MRTFLKYFYRYRSSALALIVANVLPLVGVLLWRWDAFEIVALYWTENVIIGVINVFKMITSAPQLAKIDWDRGFTPEEMTALKGTLGLPAGASEKEFELDQIQAALRKAGRVDEHFSLPSGMRQLSSILAFAFLYGWFCLLHGIFVFTIFGQEEVIGNPIEALVGLSERVYQQFLLPFLALAASHLYSFFVNYLGRDEYRRTTVGGLILQPFGRVVLLHLAIILAGFLVVALGSPVPLLILLVIGKAALDLMFHLRQREQNAIEPALGI